MVCFVSVNMVMNSNSFKEVAHVLASHADVLILGVRDEPLRTSAWEATHVLAKVRPGNGDGMFIFSIPG